MSWYWIALIIIAVMAAINLLSRIDDSAQEMAKAAKTLNALLSEQLKRERQRNGGRT